MQPVQPHGSVEVSAPARLHLGFLDLNGELGRKYGSIGLAIDHPTTTALITRSDRDEVLGHEQQRAKSAVARFKQALRLTGCYRLELKSAIPAHAGLGSGTQLALAIGAGLCELEGLKKTPFELGQILDRGARSAIGMAAFDTGGFIIDGGRGPETTLPPVLVSTSFPEDWRAILILDRSSQSVHGEKEATAFANLPPMPKEDVHRICHLTLLRLLPAISERDIAAFGTAIAEIQQLVGRHFAAAQGGRLWSNPSVEAILRKMKASGAQGIGQSSWGPTGFAFISSQGEADQLYHSLVQDAKREGLELNIAQPRNTGACIRLIANQKTTTN